MVLDCLIRCFWLCIGVTMPLAFGKPFKKPFKAFFVHLVLIHELILARQSDESSQSFCRVLLEAGFVDGSPLPRPVSDVPSHE